MPSSGSLVPVRYHSVDTATTSSTEQLVNDCAPAAISGDIGVALAAIDPDAEVDRSDEPDHSRSC